MTGVIFYNAGMIQLLWIGVAVAGLVVYGWRMRQKNLLRFVGRGMLERLGGKLNGWRESLMGGCVCVAVVLIVLAMCRPAWNAKEVEIARSGRDIVFVVDVSRSMFAEDMQPNRLERAKQAIMDCTEGLTGDRVGLVVFAGSASIKCPLTLDYNFFRNVLADISWDSAQIGGTRIGDAIQKAAEHLLNEKRSGYQDIILLTDGEDHESRPEEAATILKTGGIRLIAVGIGDAYQGKRIEVEGGETGSKSFLKYNGQEVWSRLNAPLLRKIVDAAGQGVFWEAGTGVIDLTGVYRRDIATAQRIKTEAQTMLVYEEKFQWFLAVALTLMLLRKAGAFWRSFAAKKVIVAIFVVALAGGTHSTQAGENDGLTAYNEGRFTEAVTEFQLMLDQDGKSPEVLYNLGVSLYKHGDYEDAFDAFDAATMAGAEAELTLRCVYNEGNCMFRLAEAMGQRGEDGLTMDKDGLVDMIELYAQSSRFFRAVLKAESRFEKAAFNLEMVKIRMAEAVEALKIVEQAEQMVTRQLAYVRKKLEELFARQELLADETADVIEWKTDDDIARIIAKQRLILVETDEINRVMETLKGKLPTCPIENAQGKVSDVSVMQASLEHVAKSISAEGLAIEDLAKDRLDEANEKQYMAVDALELALEAFPEVGGQEGDDTEENESEGKWTQSVKEDEGQGEGQLFELAAGEIDKISLPAPDVSPEEILEEEVMNRRQRQRKRSGKYSDVERNW
jgi:Ca-activated chloride channel family protein